MSYVLEALRRAEAERQRGNVPGLHAQTLPAPEAVEAEPGPGPRSGWPLAVGALALVSLLAAVWWWRGAAGPSTPPAEGVHRPVQVSPAGPLPETPPLTVVPRPPPPPVARTPARPAPADGPAPAGQAQGRVLPFESLPDALRRQIPAMSFGGSTYSAEPSARMVIINGQIWREGEEPSPGLTLERIALRSAQFRFRDQRFEISY